MMTGIGGYQILSHLGKTPGYEHLLSGVVQQKELQWQSNG